MKNLKKSWLRTAQVLFTILSLMFYTKSQALTSSQVIAKNNSGPNFFIDIGNCGTRAVPRAAYVAINVTNISGDTLNNVIVKLASMSNTSGGFKLLNTLDDSTRILPRIYDDSSDAAMFFVQYPCAVNVSTILTFWLMDDSNGDTVTFVDTITTHDMAPTQSGGDILYENSQSFPLLGSLCSDTVVYEFGNFTGGKLFIQPEGDTSFPANDMILIESLVVQSTMNGCGPTVGDRNLYYWQIDSNCASSGSGNEVTVIHYYINAVDNDTLFFKPYAGMKSGKPIKYAKYGVGTGVGTLINTGRTENYSITKTASCGICAVGDSITYTITITNTDTFPLMIDHIVDSLPLNHTYVGLDTSGDVDIFNSSMLPSPGATGVIKFVGKVPTTYPYRSYYLDPLDSITLVYVVDPPDTASNTLYQNMAYGIVGGDQAFDTAFAVTCVGCSALPVELIRFEGNIINNQVRLEWSTASEINNYGFDVYRLMPGNNKIHLGFVEGHGNSTIRQDYFLMDEMPISGSQVYELVQRDFDGRTESFFTSVHMPRLVVENPSISVFPNPTTDRLNVRSVSGDQLITAKVFGLDGKLLAESEGDAAANIFVNTAHLNLGIYILEVASEGEIVSRRKIYKH